MEKRSVKRRILDRLGFHAYRIADKSLFGVGNAAPTIVRYGVYGLCIYLAFGFVYDHTIGQLPGLPDISGLWPQNWGVWHYVNPYNWHTPDSVKHLHWPDSLKPAHYVDLPDWLGGGDHKDTPQTPPHHQPAPPTHTPPQTPPPAPEPTKAPEPGCWYNNIGKCFGWAKKVKFW